MYFYLSKIFFFLINPVNSFLLLMIIGVICLWFNWRRLAKFILTTAVTLALLISFIPIGTWGRIHLENRFPALTELPEKVDGIIVLGGAVDPFLSAEHGQLNLHGNAERIFEFVSLTKLYPDAKAIFTGGSGSLTRQEFKEADWAKDALERLGADTDRILFEDQSRNTFENVAFSKKLVLPKPEENWVLVTSASHMPRSMGIFRKAGWEVIPYPVDFNFTKEISLSFSFNFYRKAGDFYTAFYEFVGLFVYWLTNKTDEIYPAPLTPSSES